MSVNKIDINAVNRRAQMKAEIKAIPRVVNRKGQHYAHLVAAIKRKYE
jgi:hypothetical protein